MSPTFQDVAKQQHTIFFGPLQACMLSVSVSCDVPFLHACLALHVRTPRSRIVSLCISLLVSCSAFLGCIDFAHSRLSTHGRDIVQNERNFFRQCQQERERSSFFRATNQRTRAIDGVGSPSVENITIFFWNSHDAFQTNLLKVANPERTVCTQMAIFRQCCQIWAI